MRFHRRGDAASALPLPLALGHFVPWYTLEPDDFPLPPELAAPLNWMPPIEPNRHWNDARAGYRRTHLHMPQSGPYDSRNPDVIEWQIRTALEHGIEGFIINWYGKYSVENVITLHWLNGLLRWNSAHPDQPFTYFLSLDSQARDATEGKRPVSLHEDLMFVRDHLMTDAWLCRDGHPLFSVFPYEDDAALWVSELESVFGADEVDLVWMNSAPGAGETAVYPWIRPSDPSLEVVADHAWSDPNDAGTAWLESFYRATNRQSGLAYLMGAVWPGFDDQLVSWAWNPHRDPATIRPRVMCRETTQGNTLSQTCAVALDYIKRWATGEADCPLALPLIQVVTWNDYAEASTVEPTRDYGTGPLDTIRTFVHEARRVWPTAPTAP
ncbi:MAG: hypothetical protein HQ523_11270 [Lentisphaerae bacterium]|nr:hypothetical protein [Lentisphaerota bacterium]